jgi:hypothetical protein
MLSAPVGCIDGTEGDPRPVVPHVSGSLHLSPARQREIATVP